MILEKKNSEIDDLVSYIDNFMSKENAGHMNIKVNSKGQVTKEEILVDNTGNCVKGACQAPTLMEGLDDLGREE